MVEDITAMIKEADYRSLPGRIDRLKFLNDNLGEGYTPFPALVLEYFEETKLCFYQGAFVSTVIMASATFEELFRQFYRQANNAERANANGLASLVDFAVEDEFISLEESERITELRRLRNQFTHINVKFGRDVAGDRRTLLDYMLLWGTPEQDTLPIEDLSKSAIKIFAELVPALCNRFWGQG